jgi:hypothetical protein
MQRYILGLLWQIKKPMTFAEISARAYPPGSFEHDMVKAFGSAKVSGIRSLRRALHKLIVDGTLTAHGEGGPADPHRYYFDHIALAMITKGKAEYEEMTRWSRSGQMEKSAHLGELLLEARDQMADQEFYDWIKSGFGMTPEQAERYIDAAHQAQQKEAASK